jgi:multidrug resistance efflux pump
LILFVLAKEVMVSPLPTLRRDLIISQQNTAYGTSVIIKHPVSGKFFQLGEVEHFVARQLQGQTTLETIRQRTEARFEAVLPSETLHGFLESLKKNGFLETAVQEKRGAKQKSRRFRGSPLYCRFEVFDPCELLKHLVRRAGFFYTPYFVVFAAWTILLAAGIMFANWSDFREQIPRLYDNVYTILVVVGLNFAVIGAHEFAHGLTCTHFGGEVHEMGCALIFLQPAFYCNVSDAWLFPEKSKRLWVGFAGPYFELFLWSLAVLTWRMTEPYTSINFISMCVMTTSGVKTLLNFNPLIKLDGYYLLSDYLEIPNLRKRSFRYVGSLFETVFGFGSASRQDTENMTPRELWIFAFYGTIALAGSFSILGYILASAGGSLVAGRTPAAVLLSLVLLGMKFQRRFRRMFAVPAGTAGFIDEEDFDTPEAPEDSSNYSWAGQEYQVERLATSGSFGTTDGADNAGAVTIQNSATSGAAPQNLVGSEKPEESMASDEVLPAVYDHIHTLPDNFSCDIAILENERISKPDPSSLRKKSRSSVRKRNRWLRRSVWVCVATALVAALFHYQLELLIAGPLNILPVQNADIRTQIDGVIEQVMVTEGAVVHKGDLVAVLSTRENRSELEKTQGQIEQSNAKLRLEVAGPTAAEIDLAKTAVTKAKDNFDFSKVKLEGIQELFKNGLVARRELDNPEQLYAAAKDDLEDAEGKLKVLENGTRPEQIDQTKGEIVSLQAQERFIEGQITRAEVRSPVGGVVATPELQLKEMAGQVVQKGALIAKVFDVGKLTVEIAVPESEIADVRVGEKVSLKVRAYPNQTFYGAVTSVGTSVLSQVSSPEDGSPVSLTHVSSTSADSGAKSVLVTTEIDNSALLLKPGMTGHAKILCGRRRAIDLLRRRLARTVKVEFWSWW